MILSKWKSYLLIVFIPLLIVLSYQSIWIFSKSTKAFIVDIENRKEYWGRKKIPTQTILVEYQVDSNIYSS